MFLSVLHTPSTGVSITRRDLLITALLPAGAPLAKLLALSTGSSTAAQQPRAARGYGITPGTHSAAQPPLHAAQAWHAVRLVRCFFDLRRRFRLIDQPTPWGDFAGGKQTHITDPSTVENSGQVRGSIK